VAIVEDQRLASCIRHGACSSESIEAVVIDLDRETAGQERRGLLYLLGSPDPEFYGAQVALQRERSSIAWFRSCEARTKAPDAADGVHDGAEVATGFGGEKHQHLLGISGHRYGQTLLLAGGVQFCSRKTDCLARIGRAVEKAAMSR